MRNSFKVEHFVWSKNSGLCFFSGKMIGIPVSIWKEKKCDIQKRLFYAIETITTSADNLLPSTRINTFLRSGVAKNSVAASIFGPSEGNAESVFYARLKFQGKNKTILQLSRNYFCIFIYTGGDSERFICLMLIHKPDHFIFKFIERFYNCLELFVIFTECDFERFTCLMLIIHEPNFI